MESTFAVALAGATTAVLFGTNSIETSEYIHVTGFMLVMDQNGSFKFSDGTSDLTGTLPVAARQPLVFEGQENKDIFSTLAAGRPLQLIVGGSAAAVVGGFVNAYSDENPGV